MPTVAHRARINPHVLIWARETMGYEVDNLAHLIGVTTDAYRAWEEGSGRPTMAQLRTVADKLKRPTATFYLDAAPPTEQVLKDFRTLPESSGKATPPRLLFEIRAARTRRDTFQEFAEVLGDELSRFGLSLSIQGDPESAAKVLRESLRISLETQKAWKSDGEALSQWRSALESKDILVFQTRDVALDVARGFSIAAELLPVIAINSKDGKRAKIFTLIHELVHLCLNEGGLCDLHEHAHVEKFCNQIAASFLVPTEDLRSELNRLDFDRNIAWTDEQIKAVADIYWVSSLVILGRLLKMGWVSQQFYVNKLEEARKRVEKRPAGRSTPAQRALNQYGRSYTETILRAFYGEHITAADLSSLLGLKLRHIADVESLVRKAQ